jgi:hypothetical protein
MAEEMKQEEKGCEGKKVISTIFKVVLGLAFLVLAVYLLIGKGWWKDTWFVIKGCAGPFLILAAIITLAIAKE